MDDINAWCAVFDPTTNFTKTPGFLDLERGRKFWSPCCWSC